MAPKVGTVAVDSLLRATGLALPLAAVLAAPAAWAGPPPSWRPRLEPTVATPLRLDEGTVSSLPLLSRFRNAEVERPGAIRSYVASPWGRWGRTPWMSLRMDDALAATLHAPVPAALLPPDLDLGSLEIENPAEAEPAATDGVLSAWGVWSRITGEPTANLGLPSEPGALRSFIYGLEALWTAPKPKQPVWTPCRRRPVRFVRYGGESDAFPLVRCDGSVAVEALDRLTLVARPPEVPRPGDLLPDEPDPIAWERGEWLPDVRPVHPRLLWLLQRIADAYPWRTIYVYSGYRPPTAKSHSFHGEARAMDISVMGVRNEDLFRFCRTLDDVGCGFYPNSKFVHVDVRRPNTGRAFWIDESRPGEPSRYVDSWPSVVESGAMAWRHDRDASGRLIGGAGAPSSTSSSAHETPVAP